LFVVLAPSASFAAIGDPNCPHGLNPESSACFYGVAQEGDYTEWHNNNMYYTNGNYGSGGHINETIWAYSGSPCTAWVETGLTHGFHGSSAYEWYWAYSNTGGFYQDFPAGNTSPDGTNHAYELLYVGNGTYNVYRDFGSVGSVGGMGQGTCIALTGGEVRSGDMTVTHSDGFDNNPLQWESFGNNAWNYNWNTSQYWIDNPCGQQGYSSPNCFNGLFYSPSHYANSKP
jgi:hypothetical protein